MSDEPFWKELLHSWHENWLLRKIGIFLGAGLVAIALLIIVFFEYTSMKRAQALERGASSVVTVQPDKLDPANEGKLVHLVGPVQVKDTLTDPEFKVEVNALRLGRTVEMYLWQEKKETTKKKDETVVKYNYDLVWSKKPISSKSYNTRGHNNPDDFPFEAKTWQAEQVSVGSFALAKDLVDKIHNDERLPAETASKGPLPDGVKPHDGLFYLSNNPANPNPGDARIEFKVARPDTVSIVAKQTKDGLERYLDDGHDIALVEPGTHTAEEMFASAQSTTSGGMWILRVIVFALMGFGLYLVAKPYEDSADALPMMGDMVGYGAPYFAGVAAVALTLIVSAFVLVLFNPVMSVIFLAVAGALLFGYQKFAAARMLRAGGLDKLAPEAARFARSIRKRGGRVDIYDNEAGRPTCTVSLDGPKFNDDDVAAVANLPAVTNLSLYSTAAKGTGFAKLSGMKTLEYLSVRGDLAGNGIQAIGTLTTLKRLSISETKINDAMLGLLKNLTALEEIDLSDTSITDAGLIHVKNWPKLKEFKLSNSPITGSGLEHCKDLKQLESIWLSGNNLTDDGLAGLRNLVQLKSLWIGFSDDVKGPGLAHLQGLSKLERLDLSHMKFGDAGLPGLQKLTSLKELDLSRTKVTDAGLGNLRFLRALEKLDLYRTKITDKGLPMLLAIPSLRELCVDRTQITDAGLVHLAKLPNLRTLHLDYTQISDAGLSPLKSAPNLSWVTLSNTKVSQRGADDLQESVAGTVDLDNWRGMLEEMIGDEEE